jgi:IS30 family transposase
MDDDHLRAILEKLPQRRRRSKLEPFAALIRELRARKRSYREIVEILRERCDLRVGLHTVYQFVRKRELQRPAPKTIRLSRKRPVRQEPKAARPRQKIAPALLDSSEDIQKRIAALKARAVPPATERKEFAFDENEPLQLIKTDRKE